jgi:hypothetical protein
MSNDRIASHKAKMKRKAARVLVPGFTPIEDKRFAQVRLAKRLRGETITPNLSRWSRIKPSKNDSAAYRKQSVEA